MTARPETNPGASSQGNAPLASPARTPARTAWLVEDGGLTPSFLAQHKRWTPLLSAARTFDDRSDAICAIGTAAGKRHPRPVEYELDAQGKPVRRIQK